MLEYNFPSNPSNADVFDFGGNVYTYNAEDRTWYIQDLSPGDPIDPAKYVPTMLSDNRGFAILPIARDPSFGLAMSVRAMRDSLIAEVEWRYARYARHARLGLDQIDNIEDLDGYVQALADITKQEGFPFNVSWPTL